jgi:nucleoside-diphosphate-sugar epimerase
MKIFITGVSGFIGKSLKEYYVAQGHEVRGYYRNEELVYRLECFRPDVIINCAGEIYKPELMYSSNVEFLHYILDYMRVHPTTKLIHLGSSSEYGRMDRASAETDGIKPVDMYQATKGMGTLLCQGYAKQYGLNVAIARVYSAFGPHERAHRLFPALYRAFFQDQPMTLSKGFHDFIYIDDFVRGIDTLVNCEFVPGDIVNFGSGVETTNLEVLQAWEQVAGRTAPVTYVDEFKKNFEGGVWRCDTGYAERTYGFRTEYTLEQGIKDMIGKLNANSINDKK